MESNRFGSSIFLRYHDSNANNSSSNSGGGYSSQQQQRLNDHPDFGENLAIQSRPREHATAAGPNDNFRVQVPNHSHSYQQQQQQTVRVRVTATARASHAANSNSRAFDNISLHDNINDQEMELLRQISANFGADDDNSHHAPNNTSSVAARGSATRSSEMAPRSGGGNAAVHYTSSEQEYDSDLGIKVRKSLRNKIAKKKGATNSLDSANQPMIDRGQVTKDPWSSSEDDETAARHRGPYGRRNAQRRQREEREEEGEEMRRPNFDHGSLNAPLLTVPASSSRTNNVPPSASSSSTTAAVAAGAGHRPHGSFWFEMCSPIAQVVKKALLHLVATSILLLLAAGIVAFVYSFRYVDRNKFAVMQNRFTGTLLLSPEEQQQQQEGSRAKIFGPGRYLLGFMWEEFTVPSRLQQLTFRSQALLLRSGQPITASYVLYAKLSREHLGAVLLRVGIDGITIPVDKTKGMSVQGFSVGGRRQEEDYGYHSLIASIVSATVKNIVSRYSLDQFAFDRANVQHNIQVELQKTLPALAFVNLDSFFLQDVRLPPIVSSQKIAIFQLGMLQVTHGYAGQARAERIETARQVDVIRNKASIVRGAASAQGDTLRRDAESDRSSEVENVRGQLLAEFGRDIGLHDFRFDGNNTDGTNVVQRRSPGFRPRATQGEDARLLDLLSQELPHSPNLQALKRKMRALFSPNPSNSNSNSSGVGQNTSSGNQNANGTVPKPPPANPQQNEEETENQRKHVWSLWLRYNDLLDV